MTIIKDLYTNKVKCAKQTYKNININKRIDRRRNLLGVLAIVKASQKHEITFISFAQLNKSLKAFLANYLPLRHLARGCNKQARCSDRSMKKISTTFIYTYYF